MRNVLHPHHFHLLLPRKPDVPLEQAPVQRSKANHELLHRGKLPRPKGNTDQTELVSRQLELDEKIDLFKTRTMDLESILEESEGEDEEPMPIRVLTSEQLLESFDEKKEETKASGSKKKVDLKKFACFSVLVSCSLIPVQIGIYELENLGLENLSVTNTILTVGSFCSNVLMIFIFDKLQRRKGLMLFNGIVCVLGAVLFFTSLVWKGAGVRVFNMVICFFLKPTADMAFILTNLFLCKFE